ncbi:MAG: diacylglycerol kinase family lipid kinase [Thermoleophilia bacterium]|nr:diacylglycerol kinase family lipid kinase [Thermoleophilia bacterium]
MASFALIYNPSAGRGQAKNAALTAARYLANQGLQAELFPTFSPGHATAKAREVAFSNEVVVAVGGDGTVNEVANGLVGTPAALGIIPAGTVNVTAQELGIPREVTLACRVLLQKKIAFLDLGQVNERVFLLMVGAGIDALTVKRIQPTAKRYLRELAFVATGFRNIVAKPPIPFLVRLQEREYQATFFVASNARRYAGSLTLTPSADPFDGLLDMLIFTGTTRPSLAVFWMRVPAGLHLRDPHVVCVRGKEAVLEPLYDNEIWIQTDGELAGKIPATVRVRPCALPVVVP